MHLTRYQISLIISGHIKFDLRFKDSISGQLHTKPNDCIREDFSQFLKHSIFIPNKGNNLFHFRQKRKCFKKMALFIWIEKYVSICVIAWVIVPLPTCWKAYIISTILLHWLLWSIPETDRILPARVERPGWSSRVKFI